jgi:plasmid stabilization system protein ParE
MTRVRWTTNAANDLSRIVERIRENNPEAAQRVAGTIYTAVAELRQFPHRGRIGLAEIRESSCLPRGLTLRFATWGTARQSF